MKLNHNSYSLRKHPFPLALLSSPAAKSEEKRMFSQATTVTKKEEEGLKGQNETCHEYGKLIIGKFKLFLTFFRYNI